MDPLSIVPSIGTVTLSSPDDFEGWRDAARALALDGVAPDEIVWSTAKDAEDLFASDQYSFQDKPSNGMLTVPAAFLRLAEAAICHRDPERFALLYSLLTRLQQQPGLLRDAADPQVDRVEKLARAVRRDIHKMRAFVRFREIGEGDARRFVAWFEPDHHIVRTNAGFFVRWFANMRWSILTPEISIHWDGRVLSEGPGANRADATGDDAVEELWKRYYSSIFNPARLKVGAMLREMPKKYWHNMPETALVSGLIAGARARETAMIDTTPSRPSGDGIEALREEARECRRCPLWAPATQTVFGEGPPKARIMLVGEQPGDQEDLAGRAFVGPAGQMLDRALEEAGVDRATLYITNAVKHFKYEQRGKRRIHQKPNTGEITACRWWLDQERLLVKPQVIVALGATAAQSLLGKSVTIKTARLAPITLPDGSECRVTIHPSYLLRIEDQALADEEYRKFVNDLKTAKDRTAP